MKPLSLSALSLAFCTFAACTAPQKPYQFPVSSSTEDALPKIRVALAQQGHETQSMDTEAGIIYTRWVDTGFLMGEVQGQSATVVRRYAVIIAPSPHGVQKLTLRAETKKCAQDGFEIGGEMVTGACEGMNELAPAHQQEVDALGQQLQSQIN